MSFGIEFDIDVDDYEQQVEGASANASTNESASHDDTSIMMDAESPSSKFDKLFALTDAIRRHDRNRWLSRYASITVNDAPVPTTVTYDEGTPSASTGQAVPMPQNADTPRGHMENASAQVETDDGLENDGDMPEMSPDMASGQFPSEEAPLDDPGSKESDVTGALDMSSLLALVLSMMSVVFAFLPIIGRILWIVPAIPSVVFALTSAFKLHGKHRSILIPAIALVLTTGSVVASICMDGLYRNIGVIESTPAGHARSSAE